MKRYHLVSLGCAKNFVDSEVMLGILAQNGYELVETPEKADIIIINTCGFIQPAVEEAIDEILAHIELIKKNTTARLIVTGCLVQRYKDALEKEFPEVDFFLGTEGIYDIADAIRRLDGDGSQKLLLPERKLMTASSPRVIATPQHRAWMKITEGCDNHCSYCMIPSIRGPLRSRTIQDLVTEGHRLDVIGVKELSLIAQDLTAYGNDLDGENNITDLVKQLLEETDIPWIRLLYLFPSTIPEKLIKLIAENKRIVPYLDIPVQHASGAVLRKMNRHYNRQDLEQIITGLRNSIPDLSLRTTMLMGFPGETENDVQEVEAFIQEIEFDHLGVFGYCNEDGCPAYTYPDHVSEEEKQNRVERVMTLQSDISEKRLARYVGTMQDVLVEGVSKETDLLLEGRTRFQAPDIDGCVYINDGVVNQGEIVKIEITQAQVYDLVGRVV